MKIYIASDHRGFSVENEIVEHLKQMGMEVCTTKLVHNDNDDYADFAFELAENVAKDKESLGILICGTGIGMSIAANKVKGIRAARCVDVNDAFYSKNHNNANVICLGMENNVQKMCEIIDTFINTKKADEERHINRVNKIINYENGAYNEL